MHGPSLALHLSKTSYMLVWLLPFFVQWCCLLYLFFLIILYWVGREMFPFWTVCIRGEALVSFSGLCCFPLPVLSIFLLPQKFFLPVISFTTLDIFSVDNALISVSFFLQISTCYFLFSCKSISKTIVLDQPTACTTSFFHFVVLDTNSINAMIWRSRFIIYVLLFQSDGVEEVAKRSELVIEAYGMQIAVDV